MTAYQQRYAERDAAAVCGRLLRCIPSAALVRRVARWLKPSHQRSSRQSAIRNPQSAIIQP